MSDRIAVMNRGRVEQLGTPEEIYLRPRTPFVADFIGKANLIECTIESVAGDVATVRRPHGDPLPTRIGGVTTDSVGQAAALVLRPEHLVVSLDRPQGSCVIKAEIVEIVFQGNSIRYELADDQGVTLTASGPADDPVRRVPLGTTVWLAWSPEAGHLILAGEGSAA